MGLRSAPFLACRHPLSVSFILQNSNGIYTGFIKVQMELCKAAQPPPSLSGGGCMNTLHISSTNTVGEVIEALLKKFLVTESPTKFALYKRCHREDQGTWPHLKWKRSVCSCLSYSVAGQLIEAMSNCVCQRPGTDWKPHSDGRSL